MTDLFFYIFSAITLGSALCLVVFARNPVNAAMLLITSLLGIAAIFVLLEAYFLAVIQVLVYAGAVVVLFLFVVMLLDVKEETKKQVKPLSIVAGFIGFGILLIGVVAISSNASLKIASETLPDAPGATLKNFGYELFTTYLLPMQVTGFLLLIAMIGVIVISKKVKVEGENA